MKLCRLVYLLTLTMLCSCVTEGNIYRNPKKYTPDDAGLYDTIVKLDRAFFDAYNTCDVNLEKYSSFYADSIEFYHDKSGLLKSKQAIVEGTKNNICGKVSRELVAGSIEVYPIKNYGAVEIGLHKFHNKAEPGQKAKVGRFTIIWKKEKDRWLISKVISLH